MTREDVDRRNFTCLIIRDDMDDGDALCRAPEPLPFVQRVMLGFRRDALRRDELLPMRLGRAEGRRCRRS
ncbi:hypothetical protein AB4Z10_29590 [Bosea sp. RAF48]|uniref:hypothetical protein n=1 Tax=Bosea sp. RAF48 TaxID=3237480 RepID=UPI003F92BF6C